MSSTAVCLYLSIGIVSFFVMFGGIHKIPEGHIGVYTRGGALLSGYTNPGVHFMFPLMTKYHTVQITVQTDKVTNIPCGTSGGVVIYFDKIEVVNRLNKTLAYQTVKNYTIDYDKTWIFDKIHHEINQFCSSHSLQEVYIDQFDQLDDSLRDVRYKEKLIVRPFKVDAINTHLVLKSYQAKNPVKSVIEYKRISKEILESYEKMEREKISLLISKESAKVRNRETETEKSIQKIKAETESTISQIEMQEKILIKEGKQKVALIENEMVLEKQKNIAEVDNYRRLKEIEINQKKLTKEFIYYNAITNIKNINKNYYGENIPKYLEENLSILPVPKSKSSEESTSKKSSEKKAEKNSREI